MQSCIFCKIATREISKEFLYEDEDVVAFPDIHPMRPVHLLVIPKTHVSELIAVSDQVLFNKLFTVVNRMIKEQKLENKGYRITINGGGAQLVDHLHIHVTGPHDKPKITL